MMKKQMIFVMFVSVWVINGLSASESQEDNNSKDKNEKAFIINVNGWDSVVKGYDRENIPHTNKINGSHFRSWLYYGDQMRTDNISVVNQLEDGTFTQERLLDSFSRRELEKCYHEVAPFRTFEETNRTSYAIYKGNTERSAYDPEHLSFVEQIQSDKCVLCIFGNDKQVIVVNAKGLPEQVCKALEIKRTADIQQKFEKNISRSWRQAEKAKK